MLLFIFTQYQELDCINTSKGVSIKSTDKIVEKWVGNYDSVFANGTTTRQQDGTSIYAGSSNNIT